MYLHVPRGNTVTNKLYITFSLCKYLLGQYKISYGWYVCAHLKCLGNWVEKIILVCLKFFFLKMLSYT